MKLRFYALFGYFNIGIWNINWYFEWYFVKCIKYFVRLYFLLEKGFLIVLFQYFPKFPFWQHLQRVFYFRFLECAVVSFVVILAQEDAHFVRVELLNERCNCTYARFLLRVFFVIFLFLASARRFRCSFRATSDDYSSVGPFRLFLSSKAKFIRFIKLTGMSPAELPPSEVSRNWTACDRTSTISTIRLDEDETDSMKGNLLSSLMSWTAKCLSIILYGRNGTLWFEWHERPN